jgi:hypothetical protein
LAWLWQRYQPDSAQVSWFRERITAIRFARFFNTTSINGDILALSVIPSPANSRLGTR